MSTVSQSTVTRRSFLAVAGGLGLIACVSEAEGAAAEAKLNAWVRIEADNTVVIVVSQAEIGQGISTTLPAVIAEELGADWAKVKLENAPADPAYRNPRLNWQFTGNSESMSSFFDMMRLMGAGAREMLTAAAAERWKVPAMECRTESSKVIHTPSGRSLTFTQLAGAAAKQPAPAKPALRDPREWKLLGKSLPRVEGPSKVDGSAVFGMDFRTPGMVYGAVKTCPVISGKMVSFDRSSIKGYDGVLEVVPVPNGVVVVARTYWQAKQAAEALNVNWDLGAGESLNSAILDEQYRQAMSGSEWLRVLEPKDKAAFAAPAAHTITAQYESQFLAHATMEPMNATVSVTADGCDVWAPTQGQEMTQLVLAGVLGLPKEMVRVTRTLSGGGFGRRLVADFVVQAALASKAVGKPVQVIWSREEDIRRDIFRPAVMNRLSAGVDANGDIATLLHQIVSPSILQYVYPSGVKSDFDPSCVEGAMETHYQIPAMAVDFNLLKVAVPTSVMRTTGFGPNIFALECFIDEVAHHAKKDPYEYRRALLAGNKRALAVLDLAAEKSKWREAPAEGRHRGIAFCEAFGTFTCHVVEVSAQGTGIKIHMVTAIVDAGSTLDPGISANSIEGGVAWGLSCAMHSNVTFSGGHADQSNFHDYQVTRMNEMPPVNVHFIESGARPLGGVGEVGPVTMIPALGNAIFAATGVRYRALPLSLYGPKLI